MAFCLNTNEYVEYLASNDYMGLKKSYQETKSGTDYILIDELNVFSQSVDMGAVQ
jgi:hypothetical protein